MAKILNVPRYTSGFCHALTKIYPAQYNQLFNLRCTSQLLKQKDVCDQEENYERIRRRGIYPYAAGKPGGSKEQGYPPGECICGGSGTGFREHEILKEQLWMWMPDTFAPLSRELMRIKYPNENRPDHYLVQSPRRRLTSRFSHRQEKMEPGEAGEVRGYMGQVIEHLYPSSSILDQDLVKADQHEHEIAWMDFVTPAMDTQIYNLMFFTSLKGRLLMGSCNCLAHEQEEWKGLFIQMILSIRTA